MAIRTSHVAHLSARERIGMPLKTIATHAISNRILSFKMPVKFKIKAAAEIPERMPVHFGSPSIQFFNKSVMWIPFFRTRCSESKIGLEW